jgi:hypothetical protein
MTHSRAVARLSAYSSVLGLALLASSCASGLAFVQDRRLDITAPRAHARVSLPVTLSWTIDDFRVTGADGAADPRSGYFAVFMDRSPVPPGKPLSWIAREDRVCGRTPGCPDATYLSDHRVYSTSETTITFEHLPDLGAAGGHETHEATIVLLDGTGRRIGESAWYVTFLFDRNVA